MSFAFTFPGQGSQTVGMGRDLARAFPAARAVFEEVDEVLGERLSSIIWEGPEEALTLTRNAQPALMAVSLAALAVLQCEFGTRDGLVPVFVAGHSLGEYSALAAAGALTIADTARLLRLRGAAMQEAVPAGDGAMLALLGVDLRPAEALAEAASSEDEVCEAANDNAPGQVVISGSRLAIERAVALAPAHGIRRAVPLPVSAPFHCKLMRPAADRMEQALDRIGMKRPACPLVSNVTAEAVSDPEIIRRLLVRQITSMVRWRESVTYMADKGVTALFEIGAGRVLTGLARRIRGSLEARAVGSVEDVRSFGTWFAASVAA
jgi:[acyl-carrier-protein] S-malonyltransferase